VKLVDNVVSNNATGHGLACYMTHCTGGDGGDGGGIYIADGSSVELERNAVEWNMTGYGGNDYYPHNGGNGGGIFIAGNTSVVLRNNTIRSNSTGMGMQGGNGGGIYSQAADLVASSNRVCGNLTGPGYYEYGWPPGGAGSGGGMALVGSGRAVLTNNVLCDNFVGRDYGPEGTHDGRGSAILVYGPLFYMAHTTIARNAGRTNEAIHVAGSSAVWLTNTILVSHSVGITVASGSSAYLDSTLWGAGAWANGTNWAGDGTITHQRDYTGPPDFARPELGNYHLRAASAAVDTAVDAGVADDLDGDPRPNPDTNLPDLGADEYWPRAWITHDFYLPLVAQP
jgi:hypothetical protein